MKRHNQILIGVLVVQIILIAIVFLPKSTSAVESVPVFTDLQVGDVVALTITDAEGNIAALQQVTGSWVLPNADEYPANAEKITPVLEKILSIATGRLVTRTDASHKRLGVAEDDFERRIDIETKDGTEYTLYLGTSPNYGATHFRLAGQNETYLTDAVSTWETNAALTSWIDTSYQSIPTEDVTKMTLENTHGTFVFVKDEEGTWTMEGLAEEETLNEAKVTSTIRQAGSLSLVEPLSKEEQAAYGMDTPNAVATIETADKSVTLRVGAQGADDNSYIVKASEQTYYVKVSEFAVTNLVESAREDFLQVPPTPTPEGEPADE